MFYQKICVSLLVLCASFTATAQDNETFHGRATYYGDKSHGRRTASGDIFHKDSLTCAHKTLPFGTMLLVRNPKTGKEVIVRVTDRGPFAKNKVLDLSKAAAKEIGMLSDGIAMVEFTPLGLSPSLNVLEATKRKLPEMEFYDPNTGNYYTMRQLEQRERKRQTMAKTNAAKQKQNFLAKSKRKLRNASKALANARR